jgi:lysophospholipase L1-like esterase
MPPMGERAERPKRRWVRALVAVLAGLLLLEGALRVRQWWRYGTLADPLHLVDDPATGLRIPVAGERRGPVAINAQGFRGPEIEVPKPRGRVRLAFLGGSTTYGASASSNETTWPSVVCQGLRARHPELEFDYANGGVPGYTTEQSLVNLRARIAPLAPDVVVIYHATNDITHDTRELAQARGLWEPDTGDASDPGLSLAWHLLVKNARYWLRPERAAERQLAVDTAELARGFEERLRTLVRASAEVAPVVALVTFSHRARREQPPDVQREACRSSLYYMPFMSVPSLLDAFEAYNDAIRRAAATGALLVEDEHAIPADERHYTDSVHFTDEGCARMAERILAGLERSPAFQALLEQRRAAR